MPPSRHSRFRLRTLLVAVFVVSVPLAWVAYSLNWIRARQAALSEMERYFLLSVHDPYRPKAPALLWIFGEQGVPRLRCPHTDVPTYTEAELSRLMELFPEARTDYSDLSPAAPVN